MSEGLSARHDWETDKPGEECGVFGVYAPGANVAAMTYNGLFALQHRGQQAAGVGIIEPEGRITCIKDVGMLEDALHKGRDLAGMVSHIATGHVRYSTSQTSNEKEARAAAQPMLGGGSGRQFGVNHNGHLINFDELKAQESGLSGAGTDSQLITDLISREVKSGVGLYDSIVTATSKLRGAYSLVIMGEDKLFGVRDPKGFRPLMLGRLPDNGWVVASELPALSIVGAEFEREVEPGEVVQIDADGLKSFKPFDPDEVSTNVCAFEFVYTSRPDNVIEGETVAVTRRRAGIELARLFPVEADMILDAPDSGTSAAKGYAYATGLPLTEGLVKNRYVGRSFMAAGQAKRKAMLSSKLHAVPGIVKGQRVVLVDDSIIRGNTMQNTIEGLKNAGAAEVHLRIASPPYEWPCFMGMDTGDRGELIAAHMSVEEIRQTLKADSLHYLDPVHFERTLGKAAGKVCMACMTGEYPVPIPERLLEVGSAGRQGY